MDLEKIDKNNTSIIKYSKTDNVLNDVCSIIDSARDYAYQSVNIALVERNWLIGYRIAEEEFKKVLTQGIYIIFLTFTKHFQTF